MFYSHEVLTSRKYGVATVWLVATLGTGSERRKIKRSEIQDVNVPKACETITSTETPLALRTQSNLLFGVSRVYSQQCTFVLKDAEQVRTQVRTAMSTLRTSTTTTASSRIAKTTNITLDEDPHFALELELLPGLSNMDLDSQTFFTTEESQLTSIATGSKESQSIDDEGDISTQQLEIPSDGFSPAPPSFGVRSRTRGSSISLPQQRSGSRLGSILLQRPLQPSVILDDPGFGFGPDGNMIEGDEQERAAMTQTQKTPSVALDAGFEDTRLSREPRQSMPPQDDLNLPLDDDMNLFPDAEPLSLPPQSGHAQHSSPDQSQQRTPEAEEAVAPSRTLRQRRVLPVDTQMELRNSEYLQWEQNYTENMQHASTTKFNSRALHAAKLNALHWIQTAGILDVGAQTAVPPQLQLFTGTALYAALTSYPSPTSSKRSRSKSSTPSDEGERRVRPRLFAEVEAPRGDDAALLGSDGPLLPVNDGFDLLVPGDEEQSIEVGRHGATPLDDRPSTSRMPWNISASQRGSSVRGRLGLLSAAGGGGSSSVRGGGVELTGYGIRGSSVAPSPLVDYPRPSVGGEAGQDDVGSHDVVHSVEDVTMAGTGGGQETQLSWLSGASESDTERFYEHVLAYLAGKKTAGADAESLMDKGEEVGQQAEQISVEFEELFPPTLYDRIVASQGLMHLLTLKGRSLIEVEQGREIGFLPIAIRVA